VLLLSEAENWELRKFVIPRVKAEWENLAYCMRYKPEEVEAFRRDSKDLEESCGRLLTDWLTTSHDPKPKTYKNLLKYIKKIDKLTAVSKQIEKDLIEGKGNKISMQVITILCTANVSRGKTFVV